MVLLIRYGEIHLKGLNRPHFESLQKGAIIKALREFKTAQVVKKQGRFYVEGLKDEEMSGTIDKITKVFGLHSVSVATVAEKNIETIENSLAILAKEYMARKNITHTTFKIKVKRADKRFPLSSMQTAARCGGYVLNNVEGLEVDVVNPKLTLYVEIREECYIYTDIIPCVGGMPAKSNGRGMLLLSGGIDSPVAGYMIAKRGVEIFAVHYHSFPYTSEAAKQKVIDLAKIMSKYTGKIKLHIVSFTEIQQQIYEKCPHEMLVIIMRRFMMRIAQRLCEQNDAKAIITGESIGQVASQTMDSIYCTNDVCSIPVFRPLIGMDKQEIIEISTKIDTYNTSILPYEDCCTVFVPKHPTTRPNLQTIIDNESVLDVEGLVEKALQDIERVVIK